MDKGKKIIVFLIFIFFTVFPLYIVSAKGKLSDEAQMCLGCHSDNSLTKQLANKEILSLYINGDEFTNSVHSTLGCAGCHMDISMDNHPQDKKINSKKQYSARASEVCILCHGEIPTEKLPMHNYLTTKVKTISCSECHGAHYIKKIADWKKKISNTQYCLTCHKFDFSMTLSSGELLSLSINRDTFKNSVHGNFDCTACHMDFSKNKHPFRTFKSRKEYTIANAKACTTCHTDDQLRKNSAHYALIAKDNCISCHGSHTIKSMKAAKATAPENTYCLSCHKNKISMRMKNGETLILYVDEASVKGSVHSGLKCGDCHTGFSKTQHPSKTYENLAEYSLLSSELCNKCHADAHKKYETSIHYSMLKIGNQKAPSCVGCHGSHAIGKASIDKTLGLTLCNKCHSDMYDSYKNSIHEKLRLQGKPGTPTCSDCHNAHDVESTKMTTKIKDGCLKCHKDIEKVHSKWLYNPPITLPSFAGAHFDVVSCAACHSKDAQRLIYLSLFDRKSGKPLSEEELAKLLETDSEGLMAKLDTNTDGSIDSNKLWNVFTQLYKKGTLSIFHGKLDVSKATEAHQISAKKEAVRECENCHHPEAEFFGNVMITINRSDGKTTLLQTEKGVLNSIYTILAVSKFYVLGSTKITLFDILFIIALIGGIAVPIGHITFRIITSPLRSLRRMGKGGKK